MNLMKIGTALMVAVALSGPAVAQTRGDTTRQPFQARIILLPAGNGWETQMMDIPAGKRLVIENVSVITRSPAGMRMEVNYFTHLDMNGDNVADIADITFHRVPLLDQGLFEDTTIATANDRVLVFADGEIGTQRMKVGVQARLNGAKPAGAFSHAQFTFSGYLEPLPK